MQQKVPKCEQGFREASAASQLFRVYRILLRLCFSSLKLSLKSRFSFGDFVAGHENWFSFCVARDWDVSVCAESFRGAVWLKNCLGLWSLKTMSTPVESLSVPGPRKGGCSVSSCETCFHEVWACHRDHRFGKVVVVVEEVWYMVVLCGSEVSARSSVTANYVTSLIFDYRPIFCYGICISVVVLFRATGDAPIMKQSKFKVCGIYCNPSCAHAGSRAFSVCFNYVGWVFRAWWIFQILEIF